MNETRYNTGSNIVINPIEASEIRSPDNKERSDDQITQEVSQPILNKVQISKAQRSLLDRKVTLKSDLRTQTREFEKISRIYESSKKETEALKQSEKEVSHEIANAEMDREAAQAKIAEKEKLEKDWIGIRDEAKRISALEESCKEIEGELCVNNQVKSVLEKLLKDQKVQLDNYEIESKWLKTKLESYTSYGSSLPGPIFSIINRIVVSLYSNSIEKLRCEIENYSDRMEKSKNIVNSKNEELEYFKEFIEFKKEGLNQTKNEKSTKLSVIKAKLESLGQKIEGEFESAQTLIPLLTSANEHILQLTKETVQLTNVVKKFESQVSELQKKQENIQANIKEIQSKEAEFEQQLKTAESNIQSIEKNLREVEQKLAEVNKQKDIQTIEYEYKIGKQTYGKEVIHRDQILLQDIAFCENMIELLEKKSESLELNADEQAPIKDEIAYYQNAIKESLALMKKQDWLDSGYFRDLIKECGSFNDAIKRYISAPINMRYQEFKNTEDVSTCGFYRIGVISDMRNGWVSLKELKEMEGNSEKIDEKIGEIRNRLEGMKESEKNENIEQSATYAIGQLEKLKNPKEASVILEDRRRILQKQMIPLIIAQVGKNPEKIKQALDTGNFNMMHVCLLNQKSSKVDKSGWCHDERVEIEDMAEIFAEFQGKKLIFDGKGPSIDEEGLHMPQFDFRTPQEVTLNTYIANISVQGNTHNNNYQYALNQEQIERLIDGGFISKDDPAVKDLLNPDIKTNYTKAEKFIAYLLEQEEIAISTGCLSAKDRTGGVSALVCQHFLENELPEGVENPHREKILKNDRPAYLVTADNGHSMLKIDPRKIEGFSRYRTIRYGLNSATNLLVDNLKAKEKDDPEFDDFDNVE